MARQTAIVPRALLTLRAVAPTLGARLAEVPGVVCKRSPGSLVVDVPYHAGPIVAALVAESGATPVSITWPIPLPVALEWEQVRSALRLRGVPSAALDDLYSWQRLALCLYAERSALLQHPTGAGKTRTLALWSLYGGGPALIVTRASTVAQVAKQVESCGFPAFPARAPSARRKRDLWQTMAEYQAWAAGEGIPAIVVVGWQSLTPLAPELLAIPWRTAVFDESQYGKSWQRWQNVPLAYDPEQRAATLARIQAGGGFTKHTDDGLIGFLPAENRSTVAHNIAIIAARRLNTTATPIEDRVRDLYGQLSLLDPHSWGSWSTWAGRYTDAKRGMYGGRDTRGASNLEELAKRLHTCMHVVSVGEVRRELPGLRRLSLYVSRDDQDDPPREDLTAILEACKAGGSGELEARLALASMRKVSFVIEHVSGHVASGHKIVIFTARVEDCERLAMKMRDAFKDKPVRILSAHGGTAPEKRAALVREYRDEPGSVILIGTGQAWGVGVDGLQVTDAAYFVMLPYGTGPLEQWEGRFPRLGQTVPIVLYYVIAEGSADEHIVEILLSKLPSVERIGSTGALDGAGDALAGLDNEEARLSSVLAKLSAASFGSDADDP